MSKNARGYGVVTEVQNVKRLVNKSLPLFNVYSGIIRKT